MGHACVLKKDPSFLRVYVCSAESRTAPADKSIALPVASNNGWAANNE